VEINNECLKVKEKKKEKKKVNIDICGKGKNVITLILSPNHRHLAVHTAHMLYRPNPKLNTKVKKILALLINRGGFLDSKIKNEVKIIT
jgi:hypothetical protein